jgi:uncharacterized phosphosugar-binding protein
MGIDSNPVAGKFLASARALLERLEAQSDTIDAASRLCADAIGGGGLVHAFGTGHSRMPVEELFPRYGSYPGFHPIVELSMTFHTQVVGANGQRQAMFIERVEGLAERILANFDLGPPDAMIVFSHGGLTAAPIEMAQGARRRGLPVIAVTSVAHSRAAVPAHSSGTRLLDHADVVLDLATPPGLDDRRDRARERAQGQDGEPAGRAGRPPAGFDEPCRRRARALRTAVRRGLCRARAPPGSSPANCRHQLARSLTTWTAPGSVAPCGIV